LKEAIELGSKTEKFQKTRDFYDGTGAMKSFSYKKTKQVSLQ